MMIHLGSRRELFVDDYLVDKLKGARLRLQTPCPREVVLRHDKPWEGAFTLYATVIRDGDLYRMYYRGWPDVGSNAGAVYCYAESRDAVHWIRPDLGLFTVGGRKKNNVFLNGGRCAHSFAPFLDTRPRVNASRRFKALALDRTPDGKQAALSAFASADGIHWERLRKRPVLLNDTDHFAFDSQNVSFWSETEQCYVAYFRTWSRNPGARRISRATSPDFIHWSPSTYMEYQRFGVPVAVEEMYVNQTHPYFRAPHIYVALPARFMAGRKVITDEEARAVEVNPKYYNDCSDTVFMTTRGGKHYDRTFMEGFVRPGVTPADWTSRTNYAVQNVVQTSDTEMSLFVNHNYAQPTAYMRRYTLRLDGFSSVCAPHAGGELVTKPFVFEGSQLRLNYATSAAGRIRLELRDVQNRPVPGFALKDSPEVLGNRIDHPVCWPKAEIGKLAGKPIRLRVVMKDADLFALRFS